MSAAGSLIQPHGSLVKGHNHVFEKREEKDSIVQDILDTPVANDLFECDSLQVCILVLCAHTTISDDQIFIYVCGKSSGRFDD